MKSKTKLPLANTAITPVARFRASTFDGVGTLQVGAHSCPQCVGYLEVYGTKIGTQMPLLQVFFAKAGTPLPAPVYNPGRIEAVQFLYEGAYGALVQIATHKAASILLGQGNRIWGLTAS